MNKRFLIIVSLLIIVGALLVYSTNTSKQTPYESPKIRTLTKNSFFLGKFKPKDIVNVQPDISGIIDSVFIKIGDKVKIGDNIALLRIIPSPQILEGAKRDYRLSIVDFKQKKINYLRDSTLFSKGVISKSDFENSTSAYDFAIIERNTALGNLSIAKNGFANTDGNSPNIVKSTIEGTVINVSVESGVSVTERNTFNEGSTIATIANINSFEFDFEVGEMEINHIEVGDVFEIGVRALEGKNIKGIVSQLKPILGDDDKYSYLVSATIMEEVTNLRVGYSGLAEFELSRKEKVISIKEKNILFKGRKAYVSILRNDGEIEELNIEIGLSDGIYVEVISGLSVKDKIKLQ